MIPKFLIKTIGAKAARITMFALMALVVIIVLIGVVHSCSPNPPAAQARQDVKAADAVAGAAREAVATVVASNDREKSVDTIVNQAVKEIENAPDPVTARATVVATVCGMRAYANRPECAVQRLNP